MATDTLSPEERAAKRRAYMRAYSRQWKLDNPEKYSAGKRRHYENNKEKVLAAAKLYYELNKEAILAINRDWAKQNPGKVRAAASRWIQKNKTKHSAAGHKWLREHPDKRSAAYKRWCEKFPEKVRTHAAKRRAVRLRQSPDWVVQDELVEIYKNCPPGMHVDHIVPLRGITADGYPISGINVPWNLQYLTPSENMKKHNRMRPEDHVAAEAPVEAPRQLRLL